MKKKTKIILGVFICLALIGAIIFLTTKKDNGQEFTEIGSKEFGHELEQVQYNTVFFENCSSMSDAVAWQGSGFTSSSDLCVATNGNPDQVNHSTNFDLSGLRTGYVNISFYWNYSNLDEASTDRIGINISNNSGTNWYIVESRTIGDFNENLAGISTINLSTKVTITNNMRLKLICVSGSGETCRFDNISIFEIAIPNGALNSPTNATILTTPSIVFNSTINSLNGTIVNVSLWGDFNGTFMPLSINSSGLNNTNYIFNYTLSGFKENISNIAGRGIDYDTTSNTFWTWNDSYHKQFWTNGTLNYSCYNNPDSFNYVGGGMVSNGTNIWIYYPFDSAFGNVVYRYNNTCGSRRTYILGYSGNQDPSGITSNGTDFWVTDGEDKWVYHYNISFNDNSTSVEGFNVSEMESAGDITTNGTDFWIVDSSFINGNNIVYHYNLSGVLLDKSVITGNRNIQGLTYNKTWISNGTIIENYYLASDDNVLVYRKIPSGTYKWNIQVCDNNSSCYFIGDNRTLTVNYSQIQEASFDYDNIGRNIEEGNKTFVERATFKCLDADSGDNCGNVTAYLRYNSSSLVPDTIMNLTSYDASNPFFFTNVGLDYGGGMELLNTSDYKVPCGLMNYGDGCGVVFEGNKTNALEYEIDVIFISELIGVSAVSSTELVGSDINESSWSTEALIGDTDDAYLYEYTGVKYNTLNFTSSRCQTPVSITTNGTWIWLIDRVNDTVCRFYANGTYSGYNFTLPTNNSDSTGIVTNGTWLWITDYTNDSVHKFNMTGTRISSFSISPRVVSSRGIAMNSTHFWIVDPSVDRIFKYTIDGAYVSNFSVASQSNSGTGLYYNGSHLLLTDSISNFTYIYLANGTYINRKFFNGASGTGIHGITSNGTNIITIDPDSDRITLFWDNKPLRYQRNHVATESVGAYYGITNNNTHYWTTRSISTQNEYIYKNYINGTQFETRVDIVPPAVTNQLGIASDSNYLYISNDGLSDRIMRFYKSNLSYADFNFSTTNVTGSTPPAGLTSNGTYIWGTDVVNDRVVRWWVNGTYTGWNFTTNKGIGNTDPFGIAFNGTYFWITDSTDDVVYQYHANGSYTGRYFNLGMAGTSTTSINLISRGITHNDTNFFVSENSGTGGVFVYRMNGNPAPTAPQWSSNTTNSTSAGTWVNHSVFWWDTSLANYTFSFDNGTGSFVNDSPVVFTGANNFSNVIKFINLTVGSTIRWRVYANDSLGTTGVTDIFTYLTTALASTCWTRTGAVTSIPKGCLYNVSKGGVG